MRSLFFLCYLFLFISRTFVLATEPSLQAKEKLSASHLHQNKALSDGLVPKNKVLPSVDGDRITSANLCDPKIDFMKANNLYRDGKFKEAANLYKELLKTLSNTSVMFNLGNSWFKCWQLDGSNERSPYLGKAILCYEKVLAADPHNPDALANLEYARSFIEDKFAEDKELSPIVRNLNILWSFPTVNELEIVFIVLLWLVVLVVVIRGKIGNELFAEFSFWFLFLLVPLLIITGGWAGSRALEQRSHMEAIVLAPFSDITGSPNLDGTKLFSLHEGTKVSVVRRSGGWVQVSLPNGFSGWMREEKLGFIQEYVQ